MLPDVRVFLYRYSNRNNWADDIDANHRLWLHSDRSLHHTNPHPIHPDNRQIHHRNTHEADKCHHHNPNDRFPHSVPLPTMVWRLVSLKYIFKVKLKFKYSNGDDAGFLCLVWKLFTRGYIAIIHILFKIAYLSYNIEE